MQAFSILRRVAPIAIVAAMLFAASCTANKKYGCPNKLEVSSLIR